VKSALHVAVNIVLVLSIVLVLTTVGRARFVELSVGNRGWGDSILLVVVAEIKKVRIWSTRLWSRNSGSRATR